MKKQVAIPVSAPDIERSALAAMLLDPESSAEAIRTVKPELFHDPKYRAVFLSIRGLHELEKPIDTITVADALKASGDLEGVGGEVYLVKLTMDATSAANLPYYVAVLTEKAMLRHLSHCAISLHSEAVEHASDPFEIIVRTRAELDRIEKFLPAPNTEHISDVVVRGQELLAKMVLDPESLGILRFGFADIDRITGGALPGNMVVIGGKRKSGKTTFALHALFTNARAGCPMALFSAEMTSEEIVLRQAFIESRVSLIRALNDELDDHERDTLVQKFADLSDLPVYINDRITGIDEVVAEAKRLKRKFGIKGVVVDYVQIMSPPARDRDEGRERQVAATSLVLKRLAKKEELVVFALSQLNEDSKSRESRAIEQDADKLIYIDSNEDEELAPGSTGKGVSLKIVQRFGASGRFGDEKLWYDLTVGAFGNFAERIEPKTTVTSKDELPF